MGKKTFAYNWRKSPAYVWFLTTFLKPRQPDDNFLDIDWQSSLAEPPAKAQERFQVQGAIETAPINVQLDMQFTLAQLKKLCQSRGLSDNGSKDELIARLVNADPMTLYTSLKRELYQCTEHGRQLIYGYWSDPQSVVRQLPEKKECTAQDLSTQDKQNLLQWLWEHRIEVFIGGGVVGGVVGNAAYDGLKVLLKEAGELIEDVISVPGKSKPTTLALGIKLEWCYVPAGEFLMGSADSDPEARNNEKLQHRVYVDAFYLGKYPITNAQYRVFVQKTGHRQPSHWEDGFSHNKADHPVVYVRWSDALAFCEWAARVTGKPIRLLTEAEWEKGARGTDGRIYPWGNTWQPTYCNSYESNIKDTTPVYRYPNGRSPYGAYDMIGNVWEWTSTIYEPYPYQANDGREKIDSNKRHVLRGGSSWTNKSWARAACRYHDFDGSWYYFGFRVGVAAPFSFL